MNEQEICNPKYTLLLGCWLLSDHLHSGGVPSRVPIPNTMLSVHQNEINRQPEISFDRLADSYISNWVSARKFEKNERLCQSQVQSPWICDSKLPPSASCARANLQRSIWREQNHQQTNLQKHTVACSGRIHLPRRGSKPQSDAVNHNLNADPS